MSHFFQLDDSQIWSDRYWTIFSYKYLLKNPLAPNLFSKVAAAVTINWMLIVDGNVDVDDIRLSVVCGRWPETLFRGCSAPKFIICASGAKFVDI